MVSISESFSNSSAATTLFAGRNKKQDNSVSGILAAAGKSGGSSATDSVEISDQAKAKMKKAEADKVIAERLIAELDRRAGKTKAKTAKDTTDQSTADVANLLSANGIDPSAAALKDYLSAYGLKTSSGGSGVTGDPTLDTGIFNGQYDPTTGALRDRTPGAPVTEAEYATVVEFYQFWQNIDSRDTFGADILAAAKNGTLVLQHAEDVEGLNYRRNAQRIVDAEGNVTGQTAQNSYNQSFFTPEQNATTLSAVGWIEGFGGVVIQIPKAGSSLA
jgi:hypothetical protein